MKNRIAAIGALGVLALGAPVFAPAALAQGERPAPQVTHYCRNTVNSTGAVAYIDVLGSLRISKNDTHLFSTGCPPNSYGVFLMSPTVNWRPFGNGYLCLGKPIARLGPARLTDFKGQSKLFLDLRRFPAPYVVTPGSTWYFQCYFRDTLAGGAGFNLSSGVAALFVE